MEADMKVAITLALVVIGGIMALACLGIYVIEKAWHTIYDDWQI